MITVTLDNEKIQIKDEMSVYQYQQISKIDKDRVTPTELLSIYLDIDEDTIKNCELGDVKFIEQYIYNIITQDISKEIIFVFEMDGVKYGFENNWERLSFGAWQDLEVLTSDNIIDNIHHILAVLYRPVISQNGTKYKIEPYDSKTVLERSELMKNAPIKVFFGASSFFLSIVKRYITNTNISLKYQNKIQKMLMRGWKVLPKFLQKKVSPDFIFRV